MDTFSQKILNELSLLNSKVLELLSKYSSIERVIFDSDMYVSGHGNFGFERLPIEAMPLQNGLFKEINHIREIISVLLIDSLQSHKEEFVTLIDRILETVSQENYTWHKSINEEIEYTAANFEGIKNIITNLCPNSVDEPILIPDTNALYSNPNIEKWSFAEFGKFLVALTPSVLKDLDRHKIEHKNESVRDKATMLINKVKEYRRRGKLSESVVVVKDKINLFAIATEPNFERTLKWLDRNNEDDRLIAEAIEIIREYSNRTVILVTSDINLQNKCEFANLVYFEPPK